MKLFKARRRQSSSDLIPQVRVSAAHLTGPGKLRCRDDHLEFESDSRRQVRLDTAGLNEIVAYGELSVTGGALRLLNREGIALAWMNDRGTYVLGRLTHDASDRTLTRLLQFQAWEDRSWQVSVAREIVIAKIESTRAAVRHYQRQGKRTEALEVKPFDELARMAESATSVEQLRGIEGRAAVDWYGEFGKLLTRGWRFDGRNRRPPKDPVNALLSFGYMYLYRRVAARIEARGYEASLGALHEFRPGRLSMACDLMEPLRVPVVDRWVVAMCNQGLVAEHDFENPPSGGCYLKRERLSTVVMRLEQHWHQGMFAQHLEEYLKRWSAGLSDRISDGTSRAAAYLKRTALRGAGETQVDDL